MMIKLRIQGLADEVNEFVTDLRNHYTVLQVSGSYQNTNSQYIRVYAEVVKK